MASPEAVIDLPPMPTAGSSAAPASLMKGPRSRLQPGPKSRLEELDVLRGLAALAVVVFHYSGHATRYFTGFPFHFTVGLHGVELFFVISGFVIFMTLERTARLRDFAVSRFSRLSDLLGRARDFVCICGCSASEEGLA